MRPRRNSVLEACARITTLLLVICLSAALASCRKDAAVSDAATVGNTAAGDTKTKTASPIDKVYDRGPLHAEVHVDRDTISIADRLHLDIDADVTGDYDLTMPSLDPKEMKFAIVEHQDSPPALGDAGVVHYRRSYLLEPFLSGEYQIPPLTFTFQARGNDETPHELTTDELTVQVTSLLPEDEKNLALRDVTGPVVPPRSWTNAMTIATVAGASLLVVGAVLFVLIRRRRRRGVEARAIAAHEIAYDALQALIDEKLLERGKITEFYVRVSDILRHYIENRFGIRAPELTTEEFLGDAATNEHITGAERATLERFLHHVDLVKFALLDPSAEDIQETFDSCRGFIELTENEQAMIPVAEGR